MVGGSAKRGLGGRNRASASGPLGRGILAAACLLAFFAVSSCSSGSSPKLREQSRKTAAARVSGAPTGPQQLVFDARNGCEQIDITDTPARAFRDSRGLVHLFSTDNVARAMIGRDLDHLKHDCHVVYRSPKDADPADFQYNNWLFSFYTEDGQKVAALVHSEFDADEIAGMCATPDAPTNCWWNTVTYAESGDGGYTFKVPPPPRNLIAALPYRYAVGNQSNAYGYNSPSNIVKWGNFFYALIGDWPYRLQDYGPCLIRTADVFAPGSWRAWDGKGFAIQFADPYRRTIANPADYVCKPLYPGSTGSLVRETRSGVFITTQSVPDGRFDGPPGFYFQASRDLVHWSKPTLVVKYSDLSPADGPGKWLYEYESLIDPASSDRNFSTITEKPYLYFVRSDLNHPPYATILFRIPISLSIDGA